MTKKELVKIIQEVVRREIKKEVNKIFIEEQKTSQKLTDVIPKVSKPREKVKYTKNNTLDELNAIIDSTFLKVASLQKTKKGQKNTGGLQ